MTMLLLLPRRPAEVTHAEFSFNLSLFEPSETLYFRRFLQPKLGHFRSNYHYNNKMSLLSGHAPGMQVSAEIPDLIDFACNEDYFYECNDFEFRTISGICNNLMEWRWGAASIAMRRYFFSLALNCFREITSLLMLISSCQTSRPGLLFTFYTFLVALKVKKNILTCQVTIQK